MIRANDEGGSEICGNEMIEEEGKEGSEESKKETVWEKFQRKAERSREKEEERRKKERKEAEKREEEQRKERRRRNIIWKGIEGEGKEEIRMIIARLTRDVTGERKK